MPSPGGAAASPSNPRKKKEEVQSLQKLLALVSAKPSRQQLPALSHDLPSSPSPTTAAPPGGLQWPQPLATGGSHTKLSTEAVALEDFSLKFQAERQFKQHVHHKLLSDIFRALVSKRLANREFTDHAPAENFLRVFLCLRIFTRDPEYQSKFFELEGVQALAEHLERATNSYLTYGEGPCVIEILKAMINIIQKLASVPEQREQLVACGVHKALLLLLSSNEVIVLQCSLHALISLAQCPEPRSLIAQLNCMETLLHIIQSYDILSRKLAASLLQYLCGDSQAREMVKINDGIPLLLSILHSDSVKLLKSVVWCLVLLSEDPDASCEIRQCGGIPLLLSLLGERKFVSDRAAAGAPSSAILQSPAGASEDPPWSWPATPTGVVRDNSMPLPFEKQVEEMQDQQRQMKSAVCACLTELGRDDTNATQIVQTNGIFCIARHILPEPAFDRDKKSIENLQANAFRTLRFLFSLERNRRPFRRLFPAEMFGVFIDIGHYKHGIGSYRLLVEKINSLDEEHLAEIQESIESSNQNKVPSQYIGEYAVLEFLGSGGFGSVYKVKKKTAGQSFLAIKEFITTTLSWGASVKERSQGVADANKELVIMKEQLRHPNVVRYYRTFMELDKLYLVMEYIEGASLDEHVTSLKEKKEKFTEERIWRIFIQLVLGLRYLHKEKKIVHRDLKPNNIMLGENDKVTITDFGLAKQKEQNQSKMDSVVGTLNFRCPEIIQHQQYTEKADIWALGCILYQMCTLVPPFATTNMLVLAKSIVAAQYAPLAAGEYSDKVASTIRTCITADPVQRPDIVGVSAHVAEQLLLQMDDSRRRHAHMERKLERERRRTQKHFYEATRNMQNYHRLFLVSQERFDRLNNLQSSGGGASINESEISDSGFNEQIQELYNGAAKLEAYSLGNPIVIDAAMHDSNWGTDDEGSSSGNDSRESSAGHSRGGSAGSVQPRPPAGTPTGRRKPMQKYDPLMLEIPNSSKSCRDSGISSGDPSPNMTSPATTQPNSAPTDSRLAELTAASLRDNKRTRGFSKSASENAVNNGSPSRDSFGHTHRSRPNSATAATLTISPRKVREINDPILHMLHQLHKIIFICQLPPTLCHNPRRRMIECFKRALFAPKSTPFNLKIELQKLLTGRHEVIDLNFGPANYPKVLRQMSTDSRNDVDMGVCDAESAAETGITYEQIHNIIESVLVESGYYDMSPHGHSRTIPLAPIGTATDLYGPQRTLQSA